MRRDPEEIQQESKECEFEDERNIVQNSEVVKEKAPEKSLSEKEPSESSVAGEAQESETNEIYPCIYNMSYLGFLCTDML